MKIHLDVCCLQRPLDTISHTRIALEAEAVLGILAQSESGRVELIASEALEFELGRNPNVVRQEFAERALSGARQFVPVTERVEKRAKELKAMGLRALDALHLASAEEAGADYFCTCDDPLLRKAKTIPGLRTKPVSPVELIGVIEK
jgi:predicted nucleic acid-binding protein